MKFNYKARSKDGKLSGGVIEASSRDAAAIILQKYDVFVVSLEEQKVKKPILENINFFQKASRKDLEVFFRQLSLMLASKVPVVQCLDSLAEQARKKKFKATIQDIAGLVEEGLSLSDAFATHPKVFSNFYVSLVKSGEASGKISEILYYISDHLQKENDLIAQIRQAMAYPAFVVAVLFVVVGVIITQLVPKISDLIKETGVEPTPFTGFMLNFYGFLGYYWWTIVISLFLLSCAAVFYFRTKEGYKIYNNLSLKTPFLKDFLKKVFLVRFCSNISTLLVAGVSINKALNITQDTINNDVYKQVIYNMSKQISEGEKMSQVMADNKEYFPSFVVQTVRVGEETGKLDEVLMEVVNFYQKEIKRNIDLFATFLEPLIIIILGVILAVLAISVFSLLYDAIGVI